MALDFEIKGDPRPRWKLDELSDGVRLHIPPKKRWFVLIFALLWLVMWAVAEVSVIVQLLRHEDGTDPAFDIVWLTVWTLGGLAVVGMVLWQLSGEVVLEVSQGKFKHRIVLGPLSVGRTFDLLKIRSLRASRISEGNFSWFQFRRDFNYLGRGLLLFDYGERSIVIRPGLEPNEANNAANLLRRHLPYASA